MDGPPDAGDTAASSRRDERVAAALSGIGEFGAAGEVGGVGAVAAVLLAGSRATGTDDAWSDTDLYALWEGTPGGPDERARALAATADGGAVREETAWGPEDHFTIDGHPVEVVHLDFPAVRAQIDLAYTQGLSDEAFATAFLHTLHVGRVLRDRSGQLSVVRARLRSYPEPTHRRLLSTLPTIMTTYVAQLEKAYRRGDLIMVEHRRASIQAVYFNLLFALNRRYHPGEKRLLEHSDLCSWRPEDQRDRWVAACRMPADDPRLAGVLGGLVADLTHLTQVHS